jgi:hypothetical protein
MSRLGFGCFRDLAVEGEGSGSALGALRWVGSGAVGRIASGRHEGLGIGTASL